MKKIVFFIIAIFLVQTVAAANLCILPGAAKQNVANLLETEAEAGYQAEWKRMLDEGKVDEVQEQIDQVAEDVANRIIEKSPDLPVEDLIDEGISEEVVDILLDMKLDNLYKLAEDIRNNDYDLTFLEEKGITVDEARDIFKILEDRFYGKPLTTASALNDFVGDSVVKDVDKKMKSLVAEIEIEEQSSLLIDRLRTELKAGRISIDAYNKVVNDLKAGLVREYWLSPPKRRVKNMLANLKALSNPVFWGTMDNVQEKLENPEKQFIQGIEENLVEDMENIDVDGDLFSTYLAKKQAGEMDRRTLLSYIPFTQTRKMYTKIQPIIKSANQVVTDKVLDNILDNVKNRLTKAKALFDPGTDTGKITAALVENLRQNIIDGEISLELFQEYLDAIKTGRKVAEDHPIKKVEEIVKDAFTKETKMEEDKVKEIILATLSKAERDNVFSEVERQITQAQEEIVDKLQDNLASMIREGVFKGEYTIDQFSVFVKAELGGPLPKKPLFRKDAYDRLYTLINGHFVEEGGVEYTLGKMHDNVYLKILQKTDAELRAPEPKTSDEVAQNIFNRLKEEVELGNIDTDMIKGYLKVRNKKIPKKYRGIHAIFQGALSVDVKNIDTQAVLDALHQNKFYYDADILYEFNGFTKKEAANALVERGIPSMAVDGIIDQAWETHHGKGFETIEELTEQSIKALEDAGFDSVADLEESLEGLNDEETAAILAFTTEIEPEQRTVIVDFHAEAGLKPLQQLSPQQKTRKRFATLMPGGYHQLGTMLIAAGLLYRPKLPELEEYCDNQPDAAFCKDALNSIVDDHDKSQQAAFNEINAITSMNIPVPDTYLPAFKIKFKEYIEKGLIDPRIVVKDDPTTGKKVLDPKVKKDAGDGDLNLGNLRDYFRQKAEDAPLHLCGEVYKGKCRSSCQEKEGINPDGYCTPFGICCYGAT